MTPFLRPLLPKLLTEAIGTFYLTFCVGMSAKANPAAPLCIGGVLVAMVFAGGHVSGAHYNPTVTAAVFVRGRFGSKTALGLSPLAAALYVVAQLVGAYIGGACALGLVGQDSLGYPSFPSEKLGPAIGAECLWSFLLATVVLNVATAKAQDNNNYYGLAIGFTVLSGAVVVGGLSGGAFNAAVGLALPALAGEGSQLWVYLVFPTLSGAAAGAFFRFTSPADFGVVHTGVFAVLPALAMEWLATFFLSLYVAFSPSFGGSRMSELAMLAVTVALLSTAGATSGCHMNPAVSVGVYLRSLRSPIAAGFSMQKLSAYVVAQCMGAACAAAIAAAMLDSHPTLGIHAPIGYPLPAPASTAPKAFFAELIGTAALVYVVLNVATVRHLARNSFFGMAIGITIAAIGSAIGPVSGGCLNPAVGLLAVFGTAWGQAANGGTFTSAWIYFVAPPLGGVIAALLFRLQNYEAEYSPEAYVADTEVAKRYQAMTEGNEEQQRFMVHMPPGTVKAVDVSLSAAKFVGKLKTGTTVQDLSGQYAPSAAAKVHPSPGDALPEAYAMDAVEPIHSLDGDGGQ